MSVLKQISMTNLTMEERLKWREWVTPKSLREKPVHRWYVFPHSFTSELVHALIDEWGLGEKDRVLDPFSGAGTTILAAKERGVPAKGYDLSPLAVLATRSKIANYKISHLEQVWKTLKPALNPSRWNGASRTYPELVKKALPGRLLGAFDSIGNEIDNLSCSVSERNFFRLALLATIPQYSRAVATGGWLKWVNKRTNVRSLPSTFSIRVHEMLGDIRNKNMPSRSGWAANLGDARQLPDDDGTYSAVITSPPYPNRHDYTRVFGVELMFGFLDWEKTRNLRYQSFHSHPEAHPNRPNPNGYKQPYLLSKTLSQMRKQRNRINRMLEGYFLDMYLCLREVRRVCKPGAKIAFVVGNAQYSGKPIPVDELTAEVGEQAGLSCEKLIIARYRGNSAQQMGRYGRRPSRETIVVFRKS